MFNTYIDQIPDFIVSFFKSIKNPFRRNILKEIYDNDFLSISKLEFLTNKPSGYISTNIRKLEDSRIIQNFVSKSEPGNDYSFYKLTKTGKNFFQFYLFLLSNKYLTIELSVPFFKALSNKFRFGLLIYLMEENAKSFSDLEDISGKVKSNLNHHLELLTKSKLVKNYLKKEKKTQDYSFYSLTESGKLFLDITTEIYNVSVSNDGYIEDIIHKYLGYSKPKTENVIDINFSTWSLPNESIIGWIKLNSLEWNKMTISYSKFLNFKAFHNFHNYDFNLEKRQIEISNDKSKQNYFTMEFSSEIPIEDNAITPQLINFSFLDKNNNEICSKTIEIKIIKPIVKLSAKKIEFDTSSGFFEITIKVPSGYKLELGKLNIFIKNQYGKELKFKEEEMLPENLPIELPPEVEIKNLIGNIIFQDSGPFSIYFAIEYSDAIGNKYQAKTHELKILEKEIHKKLINLSYNFQERLLTGIAS